MQDKILIIIPAYNEQDNIEQVIVALRTTASDYDILVVNDGSSDNTENILKDLKVQYVSHPINLFYGGALQTGFKYATKNDYDYVIQFDGDGQHSAEEIPNLVAAIKNSSADIVIGSRYLRKGDYNQSLARGLGTKLFSLIVKVVTGKSITDPTSGFQILNKEVFCFYSKGDNYPQEYPDANILIMMYLAGYKITEIPVKMNPRFLGESMHKGLSTLKYVIKMFYSISIAILKGKDQRKRRLQYGC